MVVVRGFLKSIKRRINVGIVNTVYNTITCENPECGKTVTFLASQEQQELEKPENAWVRKTARLVQNLVPAPGQQRPQSHLYCSDECEIKLTATGVHNVPEPKRIQVPGAASAEAVAQAAAAAKAAEQATAAIKAGGPVTLG
jgi:hypothetical protein